jgi:lipoprotein-anchoring transpeptidase ErfK/SrfK
MSGEDGDWFRPPDSLHTLEGTGNILDRPTVIQFYSGNSAMIRRSTVAGLVAILWLVAPSAAVEIDLKAVNEVELSGKPAKPKAAFDPVILKAQVLLDRARFSPGEIDGRPGENFKKAIAAFETEQGLPADGNLDADMWSKLTGASDQPVLIEYTITGDDVRGPFVKKVPSKLEAMQELDHLGYTSLREAIAEKFHMSEKLFQALNPGKTFDRAGDIIIVANVRNDPAKEKVTRIEIDKKRKTLRAFTKDGQLLAVFPASIGSKEKPAPDGSYKITSVARNPTYRYNPEYRFKGVKSSKPFTIKPGPNNPVGSVWINLSLKGYGIHGTPDPGKIGKTESHGCIRLTNWDANTLASMVEKGATVAFLAESPDDGARAATLGTAGKSAASFKRHR